MRRSRSGWAWRDGVDAPLGEDREAYTVSWTGGIVETTSRSLIYTEQMRAADIASGAAQVSFSIRQQGDLAASLPLLVTIDLD